MEATVVRVTAMLACGLTGALLGWALMLLLDWTGAAGAVAAAAIAMVVGTSLFAACVALSNAMHRRREQ